eukprot:2901169-Pyramimonas_sp.AAC.1
MGANGDVMGAYGDGMGAYGDGVGVYGDGMGVYGDGMGVYGDGMGEYHDGMGACGDGMGVCGDGMGAYGDGMGAYGDGMGACGDGMGVYGDGMDVWGPRTNPSPVVRSTGKGKSIHLESGSQSREGGEHTPREREPIAHIGTEQDESFYPRAAVVAVRAECTNVVGGPAPAVVAPPVVCVLARVRAHLLRVRLAS